MKYHKIREGIFLSRPNRFVAQVQMGEEREVVHVKNTGRCKELLVPGRKVFLAESENPNRKTKYDLVVVDKPGVGLINMDSQAPNQVAGEWIRSKEYFPHLSACIPEQRYGESRMDFRLEVGHKTHWLEVKGVTLEDKGVASFPDAPTLRGLRHIQELIRAVEEGNEAEILFVIQMKGPKVFRPNDQTQPAFGEALLRAREAGVKILAYDCIVTENTLKLHAPVPISLEKKENL